MSRKKKTIAVAVVGTGGFNSQRDGGDFSCFLAATEQEAVQKALAARLKWGPAYRIFVGTLVGEAKTPKEYAVEKFA